jgi:MOSC domain-containing protein YiiM
METIIIDSMQGTVRAIFIKRNKGEKPVALQSAEAVPGGLAGDYHTDASKRRQILLMSGSILNELNIEPGAIYENVVVDGLDVMELQEGQQLRLGDAVVVVTIPCEPCIQMDRVRRGLQDALQNRRGMFVKVISPGVIRVGDAIGVGGPAGSKVSACCDGSQK